MNCAYCNHQFSEVEREKFSYYGNNTDEFIQCPDCDEISEIRNEKTIKGKLLYNTPQTLKRKIKSHKGGRTATIPPMRVTPSEKQIIDEARKDLSYSDYLVQKALKDVRRKNP